MSTLEASETTDPAAAPLVSVCIPTYRGAEFLGATIESVLAQSWPHFELWVVDDNSPDATEAVVKRYADPRVHYLRNPKNLGPEGNWNRCQALARGRYFKLLPHDDLLAPDCLQTQVQVLEQDRAGEIALVFGQRHIIGPDGRVLLKRGPGESRAGRIGGSALVRRSVRAGGNLIGEPGNGLFRTAALARIGLYDASQPYVVDMDYWFRLLATGDAWYTARWASSFRVSSGSWSVALQQKQHRDFRSFVARHRAAGQHGITALDAGISALRARFNTLARQLVYRFVGAAAPAPRAGAPAA
jgi:glycosyltransferase involved in cell wall biosynthesis